MTRRRIPESAVAIANDEHVSRAAERAASAAVHIHDWRVRPDIILASGDWRAVCASCGDVELRRVIAPQYVFRPDDVTTWPRA